MVVGMQDLIVENATHGRSLNPRKNSLFSCPQASQRALL